MGRKCLINSMLDNDLYKFTMQQAVLELFPDTKVEYRFMNRGEQRFTSEFVNALRVEVANMANISLTDKEYRWIEKALPYFKPWYIQYLRNYRFNPNEVQIHFDELSGGLSVIIAGTWYSAILWEVPLMAIISELYFSLVDTTWHGESVFKNLILEGQFKQARDKGTALWIGDCFYADFGTRRRRSYAVQDAVIRGLISSKSTKKAGFTGTSNVHFAMKYGVTPIGTMAHEWIMGISVLEGLRHANYFALQDWVRVYNADLGIALTATYGTDSFWENFNLRLAKIFDGVRHDSGCPFGFTEKTIEHYKKLGIDPLAKTIVFSDSLNVQKAVELRQTHCDGRIKCAFGIGTHFTNDFENSPSLNMVIKLWMCEGVNVVKLGDGTGKTMGDPDAVRVAQWTFQNKPLGEPTG